MSKRLSTPTRSHKDTVTDIYDAFEKGDLPRLLSHLHPSHTLSVNPLSASNASLPMCGTFDGHAGFTEFATAVNAVFDKQHFTVKALTELGGNRMLAEWECEFRPRVDGGTNRGREEDGEGMERMDMLDVWEFDGSGIVVGVREWWDTMFLEGVLRRAGLA
ncbi:hypothetical protein YB2330_005147 [Saitoella coloradoensis]